MSWHDFVSNILGHNIPKYHRVINIVKHNDLDCHLQSSFKVSGLKLLREVTKQRGKAAEVAHF